MTLRVLIPDQIISEEHDARSVSDVIKDVMPAPIRDPFIERKVASDKLVYMSDVRVWIDPLDATKEYTGEYTFQMTLLGLLETFLYCIHV